jgi:PAS domain S-box-containing protein
LGAVDYLVKPLIPFILRAKAAWFVELFLKVGKAERQATADRQKERAGFEETLAQERTRLREQQEWLRVTLGSIGDAVLATDPAGRVAFLNTAAQSLTGWTQQEAEGQLLETVLPLIHEETRRSLEHPLAQVIGEGVIANVGDHAVLVARDGTERPIDDSAAPIKDSEGSITGMLLTFRDVSEQRRAGVRLREEVRKTQEAEERLRMMVGSVKDYAIFSLDVQGRIVSWNTGPNTCWGTARGKPSASTSPSFSLPKTRKAAGQTGSYTRRRPRGGAATTTGPSARMVLAFGRKDGTTRCGTGNCGATSRFFVISPNESRWRTSCVSAPRH